MCPHLEYAQWGIEAYIAMRISTKVNKYLKANKTDRDV